MLTDTILINMWLLVLTGFQIIIPAQLDHPEIGGGGRGFCGKSFFFFIYFFFVSKTEGCSSGRKRFQSFNEFQMW